MSITAGPNVNRPISFWLLIEKAAWMVLVVRKNRKLHEKLLLAALLHLDDFSLLRRRGKKSKNNDRLILSGLNTMAMSCSSLAVIASIISFCLFNLCYLHVIVSDLIPTTSLHYDQYLYELVYILKSATTPLWRRSIFHPQQKTTIPGGCHCQHFRVPGT